MLKKSASIVLASFRPSTYPRGYASVLHSLRPCWTAILSILRVALSEASTGRISGRVVIAMALLFLAITVTESSRAHDPFASLKMSRLPAGSMAMPFELTSLDGTRVSLSDLAGKVVLVNFWATWCGPCKEEMPSLARLQQQLDPRKFVLLTVTTDLQRQGIAQFLSHAGVTLPRETGRCLGPVSLACGCHSAGAVR